MLNFHAATRCFYSMFSPHIPWRLSTKRQFLVKEKGMNFKMGNDWEVNSHDCSSSQHMEMDRQERHGDKKRKYKVWRGLVFQRRIEGSSLKFDWIEWDHHRENGKKRRYHSMKDCIHWSHCNKKNTEINAKGKDSLFVRVLVIVIHSFYFSI